jgi:CHAT domain-containing protein/tetratricopeptide (TPR) repeat protein
MITIALILSGLSGPCWAVPLQAKYRKAATSAPCTSGRMKAEQLRTVAEALIQKSTREDLAKARKALSESARLFQADHLNSDAAGNYLKIGEIDFIWSRYKTAFRMYRLALVLNQETDIDLKCLILSRMATAYADTGNIEEFGRSEQATDFSKCSGSPHVMAEVSNARGRLSKSPEESLEAFRSAMDRFRDSSDPDGQARASLNAGHVYFNKGLLDDALSAHNQALQLWKSIKNIYGEAQAHGALGFVLANKGNPQQAMEELDLALKIFHSMGARDDEAIINNILGLVSKNLGKYEDSRQYYTEAKAIFAKIGDRIAEIGAIDGMAQAEWALHNYHVAQSLYETKLRLARQAHHRRAEATALSGIADAYAINHDYHKARALYLQALDLCVQIPYSIAEGDVRIRLGRLYSEQKDYDGALVFLRQAVEIERDQIALSARAHFEIATVYRHQRQLEDAKNEVETVLQVIESQRTKVPDFDDRASYFASVHEYYQLYIEILMQLDGQHPGKGFAQQAFEAAEKSRVRSLLDMLGFVVPSVLTLSQIQAEIQGDDAVLLEYALGKEHSYLWVVDETGIKSYEVSNSTTRLAQLADTFRTSLLARGIRIPEETASHYMERVKQADLRYHHDQQELARALLGPALLSLHRKRVIVVPDGFLQYVPFVVLVPPYSRHQDKPTARVCEVVSLPSASALWALRDAAKRRPTRSARVAVFADPVFEADDERLPGGSSSLPKPSRPVDLKGALRDVNFGSGYIPRLSESHSEAEAIETTFGKSNVFRAEGFEANRETALRILKRYRFIHFATHGLLDTRYPRRSGLVLSLINEKRKPQDGYLRLKDIYQLKLSADLVVLSSCESALGKDLESEGMIGLTRAFLYAGSKRVISSLWKVDDSATAELMKHFYRRLHKGEGPGLALRGAQSDLAANSEWKHPYYWAAFVLQGEYR